MRVIELRNYRLTEDRGFIRYFEEHFLFSQRAEGMYPLGQFEVVGEPDRFVWIRGFESIQTRLRGLTAFYGGDFWLARRSEANALMLEHENVHLLRPLGPIAALTGGAKLEDTVSEPAGTVPPHTGLVVADFYHAERGELERVVELFEARVQPALLAEGHHVLGHFVAELAPNDYPRLPVIQDDSLLLVLSAYRDRDDCDRMRREWGRAGPAAGGGLDKLLAREMHSRHLHPTARSLIRYRDPGTP